MAKQNKLQPPHNIVSVQKSTYAAFEGPIPPPGLLKQYGEIIPDAPERILAMAEKQSLHRQYLEKIVVEGDNKRANKGQWMAFALAFLTIIGGFYLIYLSKDILGISAILGSLAALAGTFIIGNKSRREERSNKLKAAKS
jgi:uncharacterized membrane protein